STSGSITGHGSQPLANLNQAGQQSYALTAGESFRYRNQGEDSFSLSEVGSYGGGSYTLSGITYSESGSDSFGLAETVTQSISGTAALAGDLSFSGGNHALGASSRDTFQFGSL